MSLYPRLANHVFDTFDAFKEWMTVQQFDFITNPDRKPILKKGQKVFIKQSCILYGVLEDIMNIEEVLAKDAKGLLLSSLKEGQGYMFRLFSPSEPIMGLYTKQNPGDIKLKLGQTMVVQNANIDLAFESDLESFNRTTYLTITSNGGVKLDTGKFLVDCWTGEGNRQYKPNTNFSPSANSTYAFIVKSTELVYMVEIGKTSFALEQVIPDVPGDASQDKSPSVQAVSKSLAEIRALLDSAIKESSGFLVYCGVNPATKKVARVSEDEYTVDIMYAANSDKELPPPTKSSQYSLVLNDQNSVKVMQSKMITEPIFMDNALYLGEGHYGDADNAPTNLLSAIRNPVPNNLVSNLDTKTEWRFNGLTWVDTKIPCGDSQYVHSAAYLGIYDPTHDSEIQSLTLNMLFPLAWGGSIAYNSITETEWTRGNEKWTDTGNPIGTTPTIIANPIVEGTFSWDPTNSAQVRALLKFKYGDTFDTSDIIGVKGGNSWMYDKPTNDWTDTGESAEAYERIPNERYLATEDYGTGNEAANTLAIRFNEVAQEGDYVGNEGTNTDWTYDGSAWVDTEDEIGTHSTIPNPAYRGEFIFDKYDTVEVKTALDAAYPVATNKQVIYNDETGTEWEYSPADKWTNTFRLNYSTPEEVTNENIVGTFTYLEYWTPPERTLHLIYPNAKAGNYVYNLSTGTIWEFSKDTLTWIDNFTTYETDEEGKAIVPEDDANFLGQNEYATNPPTDEFILQRVFPDAKNSQFCWNLNSDTYWEMVTRKWIDTGGKTKIRFLYQQEGKYDWEEAGVSSISSGNLFHLLSRGEEASRSEVYWFANTWNIVDFETITIPQFSNEHTGTLQGALGWGYIEAVATPDGRTVGRVVGITNEGDGSKFLTDAGTYEYFDTLNEVTTDVDLYINMESGDDANNGLSPDEAWASAARLGRWLKNNLVSYQYDPNNKKYPSRVTLHVLGHCPDKDLFIDGIPYLEVVGEKEGEVKYPCKMLHITNSSVTVSDLRCDGRVVAWKSKLKTGGNIVSKGVKLVSSEWEQEEGSEFIFAPTDDLKNPVIYIDASSLMHHTSRITTLADLYSYTPFLKIAGQYVKGIDGEFASEMIRPGDKFLLEPTGEIIGADIQWMTDNIPYEYINSTDTSTPRVVPSIQTAYGTEDKTGYKIAGGKDIADVFKDKLVKSNAVFDTLDDVYALPEEKRYEGFVFYVRQREKYYYFRGGISNNNVRECIAPVYHIKYEVPKGGFYDWLNTFPFGNVTADGFLLDTPAVNNEDDIPPETGDGNTVVIGMTGLDKARFIETISKAHEHENKEVLDTLDMDDEGHLLVEGMPISSGGSSSSGSNQQEIVIVKQGERIPSNLKNNGVILEIQNNEG